MVAGLAHESRNALQRSQACLDMLALKVTERPDAINLITRIQVAQDDLQRLFEDVRYYAAPIKLERSACDLGTLWRQAWTNVLSVHTGRKARLLEALEGLDLRCDVDPFRFDQVFRNIFDNALAACLGPAEIEVTATADSLDGAAAIRVTVRDNGPGLNTEQREKIFDAFFTTKTKGTGLGMAIVKRIVDAHGGKIAVGTPPGPGAEIVLTLPKGANP
jgi:signal transduction histidine kinase